jgi:hypothetical protein
MTEQLDIPLGERSRAEFAVEGLGLRRVTVRESTPVKLIIEPFGKLPAGTVLTGPLFLGVERISGRMTQARTPDGHIYPVCLELIDPEDFKRGTRRDDVGGPADSAVVINRVDVEAVDLFE